MDEYTINLPQETQSNLMETLDPMVSDLIEYSEDENLRCWRISSGRPMPSLRRLELIHKIS